MVVVDYDGVPVRPFTVQMRVVDWQVIMAVFKFIRVALRPKFDPSDKPQGCQQCKDGKCSGWPSHRDQPASQWISDKPASVRKGELGGIHGRSVFGVRGTL